jgi:hypothetical protein
MMVHNAQQQQQQRAARSQQGNDACNYRVVLQRNIRDAGVATSRQRSLRLWRLSAIA